MLALVVPVGAQAYSFVGSDWLFSYDSLFHVQTTLGSTDVPYLSSGDPIVVSQSTPTAFVFPYTIGGIDGHGDFVVSGTTVTDINSGKTSNPFVVNLGGTDYTTRITYPTWTLVGTVLGTNSSVVDAFGDRAFHVSGDPVTINNITVEVLLNGNWTNLGSQSSFEVLGWGMDRDAVPEPATLTVLTLAGLAAWRKRRA